MKDIPRCQHVRHLLGVYVLGAIDPAERADVDAHLASCPDCREELAGLAGLPALLGRVPVAEAARLAGADPDPGRQAPGSHHPGGSAGADDILTPLLRTLAQRRRVNRWRSLAAAAAVLVIAAGSAIGAVQVADHRSGPVALRWEAAAATNANTHVSTDIRYAGTSSGTRLEVRVDAISAGTTCEFWVVGPHGRRWQAGSWTEPRSWWSPWYQATSAAPISAVRGFQITTGHTVLVTAPA